MLATLSLSATLARVVFIPATSKFSLIVMGTPWKGPQKVPLTEPGPPRPLPGRLFDRLDYRVQVRVEPLT